MITFISSIVSTDIPVSFDRADMDKTQDQDTLNQLQAGENSHAHLDFNEDVGIPCTMEVNCSGLGSGQDL